jgi:hypothetical protein
MMFAMVVSANHYLVDAEGRALVAASASLITLPIDAVGVVAADPGDGIVRKRRPHLRGQRDQLFDQVEL